MIFLFAGATSGGGGTSPQSSAEAIRIGGELEGLAAYLVDATAKDSAGELDIRAVKSTGSGSELVAAYAFELGRIDNLYFTGTGDQLSFVY